MQSVFVESQEGQPPREAGLLAFADRPKSGPPPVDNTTPLSIRKPAASPNPAPTPAARERVSEPAHSFKFPAANASDLDAAWDEFFANNKPPVTVVSGHLLKLHSAGQHKPVIAAIRAALINGQAQPWMYDALAGSMAIEKYPQEEIERVLLSKTDFGEANFETMLYTAANLVRFDRLDAALSMYRQASRLQPEQPAPYILCVEHAAGLTDPADVLWAACGVLKYDWSQDRAAHVKAALGAIATLEREYTRIGNQQALATLKTAVADAQSADVHVEVVWSGKGDVDLEVEEPGGSVCAVNALQTSGGGYHLGDGYGPRPEDCKEIYICPRGFSGEYRIRVKQSFGDVVGRRATLTITTHKGTPAESRETRTVELQNGVVTTTVRLENGRRVQERTVQIAAPARQAVTRRPAAKGPRRDPNVIPAGGQQGGGPAGAITGVVGYQPIITNIREGASLGAHAIVSPDRRYVRLGISPVFSNITDVFTFSVFGGSPTAFGNSGGGGPQPPNR